jgi:transcriptional regulator with XRE-family HTH domain
MGVGHIQGMDIRARILSTIEANPDMTVRSVSLAAGLSDSALHKFLSGATESITLKTLEKLADALGVDARWLAFGEGDPDRATNISKLFDRIAQQDQESVLRLMESLARTGTDG